MNQSRTIKVFLGSSVVELKNERQDLNSLSNEIKNLLRRDNIDATFFKSEALGITAENFKEHDQARIDKELLTCDLSLFLFKTRAGEGTCHEYDVACDLQKKRKNHKITICCLNVHENEKEDSLKAFQKKIVDEGGYWENCRDLSEVRRVISFSVLHHLGITLPTTPEADVAEKLGAKLFSIIKEQIQEELKPRLHGVIDDLLAQIPVIMASPTDSIVAKIVKASELYYKADLWASKTDYKKEKYYVLLAKYAEFLCDYGLYSDSKDVYISQIKIANLLGRNEEEKLSNTYNDIAVMLRLKGEFEESLKYHKKAIKLREVIFGDENETTAVSYKNIAFVYKDLGNYQKSLEYHRKALEIRKKTKGMKNTDAADSFDGIGAVYWRQGEYDKALRYLNKSLKIRETIYGLFHQDTATAYSNIGLVYKDRGNYSKALVNVFKAFSIYTIILGVNHPFTATALNNIGVIYYNQKNYTHAFDFHYEALIIRKNTLNPYHPDIAQSYHNIGVVLREQGKYPEALEKLKEALKIDEMVLDSDHPSLAYDFYNIGRLYYMLGEYDSALTYFLKALEIRNTKLGKKNPQTEETQKWIGITKTAMVNK